ncbi:dTDP-4-amino-4,6-dideoxygalactose transaminase [Chitinophaga sp. CF118]|uniref:DegT/DnrJ/EryC1/StrS family aminotransferase n=1 Tax=Chitinophaga sp. CF118 TaxID=1884367 RepID=UPI0008EC9FE6|nr:DegT/DnrJ/EryC1/StrS family aminotransferase [Chitinophaga sp. CF118]SFD80518.1 dTDP-4-amino-4,6-dideoxygalactose transaminase [Chitinophaga sp. CF118]
MNIQMVDLRSQYLKIKDEVDEAVLNCIDSAAFINGPSVNEFVSDLARYIDCRHVIPCANGTDALQIAMMALGLQQGDEIIVPAFTYVATAEVIALLGLVPVLVDVHPGTFMLDVNDVTAKITDRTKAIVPVHLFGQCADMESLISLAKAHQLFIIEDTAQAIGATYTFSDGYRGKAGVMGDIGCTSFFPSKNLGCFGDGGAIFTSNDEYARRIKMIANHGQERKYYHDVVGINSRLDTLQAAVLRVKLQHLDRYAISRNEAAAFYDNALSVLEEEMIIPQRVSNSTHVFHQYTLKVKNGKRDQLKEYLQKNGIPTMIYYPLPLHFQKAYQSDNYQPGSFPVAEVLCTEVLSLPMHTEMSEQELNFIVSNIKQFYSK